jgi:hypothetical protein
MNSSPDGADALSGIVLPSRVQTHTEKHLARLMRALTAVDVHRALERAEGFVEGLEVAGALNPGTIEALYTAVDKVAESRLLALQPRKDG